MAVTVKVELDTDSLRDLVSKLREELREELKCPCHKGQVYTDYIESVTYHDNTQDWTKVVPGRWRLEDVFAMREEMWSRR